MKRILTVILSLVLALALVFAMVACDETQKGPDNSGTDTEQGGTNTDDEQGNTDDEQGGTDGDKEEEPALEPVDAKVFAKTVLQQISEAEGFSVALSAEAKGSVTAPDDTGASVTAPLDQTVSDTYPLEQTYATNALTVFEDLCSLVGGISGIEDIFAGTVQPLADNSGYEYTVTIETEQVQAVLSTVQAFFAKGTDEQGEETPSAAEQITLGDIFKAVLPSTAPEGADLGADATADDIAKAWVAEIFSADFTVGDTVDLLNTILAEKQIADTANKVVRVITGIAIGTPMDINMISTILSSLMVTVEEDGTITIGQGTVPLTDITLAALIDPMLAQQASGMTFASLGMLLPWVWDEFNVASIYDIVVDMTGMPLPKSGDFASVTIEKAELTVTVTADKTMKLTSFRANAAVKGSYSIVDAMEATVSEYAADITASANGTFGYEAVEAGDNAGSADAEVAA